MTAYDFRRVEHTDFGRLRRWLAAPHVARWWGDPEQALLKIEEHLTSVSVAPYIMLIDGQPVGYLQSYELDREVDHPYRDQPARTVGIDLSIGVPELVGKGHGPRLIDEFVTRLFAAGAKRVVIDPHPANAAAIRAYMKAGFSALGPRNSIYGSVLLMARDNPDETRPK